MTTTRHRRARTAFSSLDVIPRRHRRPLTSPIVVPNAVHRRALLGGLAAAGLLAGCAAEPSAPASTPATATVIKHKFGATTIPEKVERVVTVGWNDQDFVLPLGVVPVAARAWFDTYDQLPWVQEATGGQGVPLWKGDDINPEAIAAARPDVILAIYEEFDEATYDKLSKIAPTVVQSADYGDGLTPWDVQLLTTGQAVHKEAEAEALVADVKGKIAAAITGHPEFAGKVAVVDYGPENGGHWLVPGGDPRRGLIDALGFAAQETEGDLSEERLSLMDRDVLFVMGATKDQLMDSELFARLAVVKEGRTLYTTFESALAGALSYGGPDSLRYALDVLVPELSNALTGKPVRDLTNA